MSLCFLKMTSSLKSDNITILVLGFKVDNIILLTHLLPNQKKSKVKKRKKCLFSSKTVRWPFVFSVFLASSPFAV